jgi:hypothetical protein
MQLHPLASSGQISGGNQRNSWACSLFASILFVGLTVSEAAIVMMDQIGIRFVLICNLILWAVLVYLLVLAVR